MPFDTSPELDAAAAGVGGSDTQVQFNDAGTLAGDAGLTYNKTTDTLTATQFSGGGAGLTGVNADTVDGSHAAAFAAAAHTHAGGDITSAVATATSAGTATTATTAGDGVSSATGTAPLTLGLAAKALTGSVASGSTTAEGVVQFATDGEVAATKAVQANDARLSNARTPAAHALVDTTGHSASGLTTGHFLKATGATTYGFGAHGLTNTDVGAAAASHAHAATDITSGILDELYGGTGQDSYATGDTLYASTTNTLAKRTIGNTGDVFTVAGGVPTWAAPAASGQMTYDAIVAATGGDYTTVGAAVAAGKYRLFVRDGTYTETGFHIPTGQTFIMHGESEAGTILNFTTGNDVGECITFDGTTTTRSVVIENITLKVSLTAQPASTVFFPFYYLRQSHCTGVTFELGATLATAGTCLVKASGGLTAPAEPLVFTACNFTAASTSQTKLHYLFWSSGAAELIGCFFFGVSNSRGIYTQGNTKVTSCSFENCTYGISSNGGWVSVVNTRFNACYIPLEIVGGTYSNVSNCYFYLFAGIGIYMRTNNALISNNTFYATANNANGIQTANSPTNCIIRGNMFRLTGTGTTGIILASTDNYWIITHNQFAACVTTITDGGKGTIVQGNIGVLDYIRSANNAQWTWGQASELLTLSTAGTTTDTTANLLPANSVIESVDVCVTTTITTATDWSVGDGTTAARFAAANATMTAGATSVGLQHLQGSVATDAAGPVQAAAAKVRITTTGTPGAGVVRITVFYKTYAAPTS